MRKQATWLLLLGLLAAPFLGACGRDCTPERPCCEPGKPCSCEGGTELCTISCEGTPDCQPACNGQFGQCAIDCGGAPCEATCTGGDLCHTSCGADCSLSCTSASICQTECGDRCTYDCRQVSSCDVEVGAESSVHCESVGSCHAVCLGDCWVECPMSGSCEVECREMGSEELIPAIDCGPNQKACGGCEAARMHAQEAVDG